MAALRDILVAVAGLTPQVITEMLYYPTPVCHSPFTLAAMHVLITRY
jgi:CRISPR-associated protein (TIGR02584 family)